VRSYLYYRSGNKSVASDLTQDTFLKFWAKQLKPDPVYHHQGLLYKIAGDLFITHTRRQKVRQDYQEKIELDVSSENPEEALAYNELKKNYEKCLSLLTEKQRVVFLMSRLDDLSYREIAEKISVSVKAIEKRMGIALSQLKACLNR